MTAQPAGGYLRSHHCLDEIGALGASPRPTLPAMSTQPPLETATGAEPEAAELTVYFDGGCPICSREIAMYRNQEGADRCAWVDASSCPEATFGPGLSREKALARIHVRRADGTLVDGVRGFALLWQKLPRFAWAGRIASLGPIPVVLDAAYAVFLRVRPLWRGSVHGAATKR